MQIEVNITPEPIQPDGTLPADLTGKAGAIVEFLGVVRAEENNQPIAALEYEAYVPMAEKVIRQIIKQLAEAYSCLYVGVSHRIGIVPKGDAAIRVVVASIHRAEAFALATALVEKLKQDAPIWKKPLRAI